ncbi:MAG: hypothetical protein KKE84_05420 [Gammaproteobacteria bacterium]|nr:hypothetical protein [Gammaproteobacteria bacterium]
MFSDLDNHDVSEVGGKNASLGEMTLCPGSAGIRVPEGFATTARAYRDFRARDHLSARIGDLPDGQHESCLNIRSG